VQREEAIGRREMKKKKMRKKDTVKERERGR
jgi:hypothetical protein